MQILCVLDEFLQIPYKSLQALFRYLGTSYAYVHSVCMHGGRERLVALWHVDIRDASDRYFENAVLFRRQLSVNIPSRVKTELLEHVGFMWFSSIAYFAGSNMDVRKGYNGIHFSFCRFLMCLTG